MSRKFSILLLFSLLTVALGASLLDYLGLEDDAKKYIESKDDQPNRNCMCKGAACACCVDFNITFVDVGPGCVHMKYLSPEDGFSVNISYGKKILHSSKIKGPNPTPMCLNVFDQYAQVCATFSDLAPTSDGLRGCLDFAPKFLGQIPLHFPIGCFRSNAGNMEMEDPPAETEESVNSEESSEDNIAENFILSMYQTAEQGVSFISSLFDIPKKPNEKKPANDVETTTAQPQEDEEEEEEEEESTTEEAGRRSKDLKHPNQL